MAKDKISDWSATPASNTDIGGISVAGTAAVSNFDNAFREIMAQLAQVADGTDAMPDTFALGDPADLTKRVRFDVNGITTSTTRVIAVPDADGVMLLDSVVTFGQCYLQINSTNLQLIRNNGKLLTINGVGETVPVAGITLSPSGLSSATVYYIYAYMNSGTMTLEASTTADTVNSANGVRVKTGDTSRTLVGWARTNGSTAWADDTTSAHVISYYNPKPKRLVAVQTASRAFSATSMAEINSEFRVFFLAHPDRDVTLNFIGGFFQSAGNNRTYVSCAVDTTVYEGIALQPADTGGYSCACSASITGLSEATSYTGGVYGAVSSGTSTLQFVSANPGFRCSLNAIVWG